MWKTGYRHVMVLVWMSENLTVCSLLPCGTKGKKSGSQTVEPSYWLQALSWLATMTEMLVVLGIVKTSKSESGEISTHPQKHRLGSIFFFFNLGSGVWWTDFPWPSPMLSKGYQGTHCSPEVPDQDSSWPHGSDCKCLGKAGHPDSPARDKLQSPTHELHLYVPPPPPLSSPSPHLIP